MDTAVLRGCAAGTFTNSSGQSECTKCPPGEFQIAEGKTACETCEAGSYCKEGASVALPCEEGSYSKATNLTSAAECTACPAGSACSTGSTDHTPCSPGTYTDTERAATCTPCAEGEYQMLRGQTDCEPCTDGHYCGEGAAAPLPPRHSSGRRCTARNRFGRGASGTRLPRTACTLPPAPCRCTFPGCTACDPSSPSSTRCPPDRRCTRRPTSGWSPLSTSPPRTAAPPTRPPCSSSPPRTSRTPSCPRRSGTRPAGTWCTPTGPSCS